KPRFTDADPRQFVEILATHAVLIEPSEDEIEALWAFVPIKAKWNVWKRREDRLTLWTAWGERPVQQVFLDPDETKIWDALDGNKRLIELRHHHDNAKIINLVRRLVHSDVQDAVGALCEASGHGAAVPGVDDAVRGVEARPAGPAARRAHRLLQARRH